VNTRVNAGTPEPCEAEQVKQRLTEKLNLAQLERAFSDGGPQSAQSFPRSQSSLTARLDRTTYHLNSERVPSVDAEGFALQARREATPLSQRRLKESVQLVAAALSGESEEIVADQRMAERFACGPLTPPKAPPKRPSEFLPYMAAAALMLVLTGGASAYFLQSGSGKSPAGDRSQVSPLAQREDSLFDTTEERNALASLAFTAPQAAEDPSELPRSARAPRISDEAAAENWAMAVETLRLLSSASVKPAARGKPTGNGAVLQQLDAWQNASKAK
jgi:hypothetical protein